MKTPSAAIQVRGLTKVFPSFQLGPLDLTVPTGSIYAFIGPNGAGKTTTIDLLLSMGQPTSGHREVCGFNLDTSDAEAKRHIGYVSPELNFATWGRIDRALRFIKGFYPTWDDAYCNRLLAAFGLESTAKIATLSFGQKIKLSLVTALAHRPELLILDEPTVGLDAVSKRQIFAELLAAVREGERTVFLSSHGLTDLERFADHVGMIRGGKLLVEGPMDDVVGRFRMVDFDWDATGQSADLEGVFFQQRDSKRCRALVDHTAPGWRRIQSLGGIELASNPVTLEEVFIALAEQPQSNPTRR